jgi:hypothetical protein
MFSSRWAVDVVPGMGNRDGGAVGRAGLEPATLGVPVGDFAPIPVRRAYTDQDSTLSNRCSPGVISDASYSGASSER